MKNSSDMPRILVADDETRIHDFFIEACKGEETGDGLSEIERLEKALFKTDEENMLHAEPAERGYRLTLCTSGPQAVEHVIRSIEEGQPFSVVFLDVRMPPGPDGVWAAEKIRTIDKDIEIVIVTAFSDIHPSEILRRVPPAHKLLYLQKPCYVLEIRHMAAALSSKWAMEKDLRKIQEQQEKRIQTQESALDEAYQALSRMQKLDALGMFAGGVAHDFNNIMAAIIGHTELALVETKEQHKLHRRIENIHKACFRAKELVSRILTFSRQTDPEYVNMVIGETVMDVLKLIRASVPRNIRLTFTIPETPMWIFADPTQIHQVLMNLCSNALHAMKDTGGVLNLQLGRARDFRELRDKLKPGDDSAYVVMSVSDTGMGMDERTMEKMFDPYFTTKGKNEGTGLGLAVIHGIIKKLGGFIHVESEPGIGTRFYVFFKLIE